MRNICIYCILSLGVFSAFGQTLKLKNQEFELHNVKGSVIKFEGRNVLKIERDLNAIPFDVNNIEATVDEPHYARLIGLDDFELEL